MTEALSVQAGDEEKIAWLPSLVCPGHGVPGLVSVIIPVYNGERYVGAAIESVRAQTYRQVEIIVVDDASTDGSYAVAQRYAPHIRLLRERVNRGQGAATNVALEIVAGEYIAFLDADDLWVPDKLKVQVEVLRARPDVDFCATGIYLGDSQGRSRVRRHVPLRMTLEDMLYSCPCGPSTVMLRRSALHRSGGFDGTIRLYEDRDLWLRLLSTGACYMGVDQPLCIHRRHGRNKTSWASTLMRSDALQVTEKYVHDPLVPPHMRPEMQIKLRYDMVERLLQLSADGHTAALDEAVHAVRGLSLSLEEAIGCLVHAVSRTAALCQDNGINGRWITYFPFLDPGRLYATMRLVSPDMTMKNCHEIRATGLMHCANTAAELGNRKMAIRYCAQATAAEATTVFRRGNRSFLIHALLGTRIHGMLVAARSYLRQLPGRRPHAPWQASK